MVADKSVTRFATGKIPVAKGEQKRSGKIVHRKKQTRKVYRFALVRFYNVISYCFPACNTA